MSWKRLCLGNETPRSLLHFISVTLCDPELTTVQFHNFGLIRSNSQSSILNPTEAASSFLL